MHKLLPLCAAAALAFTLGVGHAAETAAKTAQQSKMASCNADPKAKELKGDERKAFMKECLSANKQEKQQTKMATCSADFKATGKAGKERQAFMKECLSNKESPATAATPAAPAPAAAPSAVPAPAAAAATSAAPAAKK